MANELEQLRDSVRRFAADRDWDQFHSPKNLASALIVEAGELLEHFQWLKEAESHQLDESKLSEVQDEIADVLIYLVRLADKLNVDLMVAAKNKIERNAQKYPIDKARGSMKKYSEL